MSNLRVVGPDEKATHSRFYEFTDQELDWLMASVQFLQHRLLPVLKRYPGSEMGIQDILTGIDRSNPLPTEKELEEFMYNKLNTRPVVREWETIHRLILEYSKANPNVFVHTHHEDVPEGCTSPFEKAFEDLYREMEK